MYNQNKSNSDILNALATIISGIEEQKNILKDHEYIIKDLNRNITEIKKDLDDIKSKVSVSEKSILLLNEVAIPCVQKGIESINKMFSDEKEPEKKITPKSLYQDIYLLQQKSSWTWNITIFNLLFMLLQGEKYLSVQTEKIINFLTNF